MNSMQVFYAPDISGDVYVLGLDESKHIVRVLRMTRGTAVKLIDGKGNLYEGRIDDPDPKKCTITVTGIIREFEKRNYSLNIAISPLKNPDRFEWFVEKSVEIGIDRITPLICRNTEKKSVKHGRINNIIISAMKQSLKANLTVLDEPVSFNEFIMLKLEGNLMIAHCNSSFGRKKITDVYRETENAVILIGPEGDFSEEEIRLAAAGGFSQIHLGDSRLRTETAGIAACHSVYLINQ
jgi:16S rRNA (uracil1498-N3)-methyltransferase